MPSLLDKTHGYATTVIRRTLGKDDRSRIRALEKRIEELERVIANDLRVFNGHTINDHSQNIILDHKRRTHWQCDDGTIDYEKVTGKPYAINACVDVAEVVQIIIDTPDYIDNICDACPGAGPGIL